MAAIAVTTAEAEGAAVAALKQAEMAGPVQRGSEPRLLRQISLRRRQSSWSPLSFCSA